jgi:hypothetical protein
MHGNLKVIVSYSAARRGMRKQKSERQLPFWLLNKFLMSTSQWMMGRRALL